MIGELVDPDQIGSVFEHFKGFLQVSTPASFPSSLSWVAARASAGSGPNGDSEAEEGERLFSSSDVRGGLLPGW